MSRCYGCCQENCGYTRCSCACHDGIAAAPATSELPRVVTQLIYMGHPVSGDVDRNVQRALVWLSWLRRMHPDAAIIAPWIAAILSGEDDGDPAQRERGLRDCQTTAARCDGIVLVGPRISSGMLAELAACRDAGGWVSNLTALGAQPPTSWEFDKSPLEVGLDVWRSP